MKSFKYIFKNALPSFFRYPGGAGSVVGHFCFPTSWNGALLLQMAAAAIMWPESSHLSIAIVEVLLHSSQWGSRGGVPLAAPGHVQNEAVLGRGLELWGRQPDPPTTPPPAGSAGRQAYMSCLFKSIRAVAMALFQLSVCTVYNPGCIHVY